LPHGIEDSQITNFEITHTPVTNRRSLAIMSRKSWYLALSDEACGIGVTLAEQDGKIRIAHVMPNSPASRFEQIVAGVELLTLADDEHPKTELAKSTVEAAEKLIYGSVGSLLTLQIVPIGKAPKDAITVTLRRAAIQLD
jgi:C-terminal processing protease CtpA/Prc